MMLCLGLVCFVLLTGSEMLNITYLLLHCRWIKEQKTTISYVANEIKAVCQSFFFPLCFLILQKLSALSASLARVVSAEDEEAEVDQFPIEGVRK